MVIETTIEAMATTITNIGDMAITITEAMIAVAIEVAINL